MRPLLPDAAFIMLSQVTSKDMVASAYEAGVEFFIQKPINSIEVESVIRKIQENLSMRRTMNRIQNIFLEDTMPKQPAKASPAAAPASSCPRQYPAAAWDYRSSRKQRHHHRGRIYDRQSCTFR